MKLITNRNKFTTLHKDNLETGKLYMLDIFDSTVYMCVNGYGFQGVVAVATTNPGPNAGLGILTPFSGMRDTGWVPFEGELREV